jgi:superfamily I DNA and/or RNA helicase
MRQADVIVSTCIGAADSRLLAACGFTSDDEEDDTHVNLKKKHDAKSPTAYPNDTRGLAPDRMPPIYLPFVILDESCQSVEPATLVPIFSSNSCQSIVMLGDPCQLPPTVISDESGSGASQLSLSLMSRLAMILQSPLSYVSKQNDGGTDETFLSSRATKQAKSLIKFRSRDSPVIIPKKKYSGSLLLSIQYRMHPSISAFPSAIFYDGMLHTPSILSQNRRFPIVLGSMLQAEDASIGIRFINISGNNEIRGASTSLLSEFQSVVDSESPLENFSISNRKEAQQVVSLMKEFLSRSEKGERFAGSIGVVTPYSAQVSLLESLVSSDTELLSLIERCNCTIEINSVDAYQGRERDIIIFSTVRSNNLAKVGFLSDWRRMNVALTRAKSALIVVGDLQTLKQGDMHWEAFCIWLETYGCVHDAVTVV